MGTDITITLHATPIYSNLKFTTYDLTIKNTLLSKNNCKDKVDTSTTLYPISSFFFLRSPPQTMQQCKGLLGCFSIKGSTEESVCQVPSGSKHQCFLLQPPRCWDTQTPWGHESNYHLFGAPYILPQTNDFDSWCSCWPPWAVWAWPEPHASQVLTQHTSGLPHYTRTIHQWPFLYEQI